ncbi:DUF4304 domain-containing protein [Nocardioides sp. SYSU D00038]|uniref:DUF4304 domain-containing protein n=1 Tax=Nocardioides sp. SYSU D00038 TaxID=2812554 RepID=UPI001967E15D
MSAQEALKATLRDHLGPIARLKGYKGSAPTWRKASAAGDWAIVNVQSSSFSSADLRCVVNLAFAPEPWLRWRTHHLGAGMPRTVSESLGLYRERLHPQGTPESTDGWWDVTDDGSARLAVADMVTQLNAAGWPVLESMFSREVMLRRLQDGDLGRMQQRSNREVFYACAEALLLMDAGPSDALESRLRYALDHATHRENAERFDTWVRAEAAKGVTGDPLMPRPLGPADDGLSR